MKKTAKLAIAIGLSFPLLVGVGTVLIIASNRSTASANPDNRTDIVELSEENINRPNQNQSIAYPKQLVECFGYLKDSHNVTHHQEFDDSYHLIIWQAKIGDAFPTVQGFAIKDDKCSSLNLGLAQWEGKVPKSVAIEMKQFRWKILKEYNPEEFNKMITVPSEVALPFFPEDKEAIASLGHELKVRVFEDEDEYFLYSVENDPYTIKDHPGVKRKLEELEQKK